MGKHDPAIGVDYNVLSSGVISVARGSNTPTDDSGDIGHVPDYLNLVDHSLRLKKKKYRQRLEEEEERFNKLVRQLGAAKRSLVVVLQGRDTAGKSGAARRIWEATNFDPKLVQWIPIGPPSDEERNHPHLWRFFRNERMPAFGEVRIFDRSWAERLLVEPVMKIINQQTLQRSFCELRLFEYMLSQMSRVVLVKFWMDITKDEQARRFEERRKHRPEKLSDSDAVARKHWDDYTGAANAMFHRTGTSYAPWHIVSSEDKRYSRVSVLETINSIMTEKL
ncbi:MAG: hypothetical protein K2W82_11130 [Candidatus Obscuribacterales bacterium]|nr:hypothetical protein [Candidatus Obscuribacterales bacterium]